MINVTKSSTTGELIRIMGSNFLNTGDLMTVTVGDKICENVTITQINTEITCIAPPGVGKSSLQIFYQNKQIASTFFRYQGNFQLEFSTNV